MMSYLLGAFFCCISFFAFQTIFIQRDHSSYTDLRERLIRFVTQRIAHFFSSTHKSHWMNIHFCKVWFEKKGPHVIFFFTSRPYSAKWLLTSLKQLLLLSMILTTKALLRRGFEVDLTGVAWKPPA